MFKNFSLVALLVIAVPCMAATTSWEAFDMKNCKHWAMSPDDYDVRNRYNYNVARDLAEDLNKRDKDRRWFVVQGRILYEKSDDQYGVCSLQGNLLDCVKDEDVDFPLSGATYQRADSEVTYKCIRGCDTTEIRMIHPMAYDPEYSGESVEYVRLYEVFDGKCHDKKKKMRFYQDMEEQQNKEQQNKSSKLFLYSPPSLNQILENSLRPKSR